MADDFSGFRQLLTAGPRMPRYLRPAANRLEAHVDALAATLSEFVGDTVKPLGAEAARRLATLPDDAREVCLDGGGFGGPAPLRLRIARGQLAELMRLLFRGEVNEPMIAVGVTQAIGCRLMGHVLGMPGAPASALGLAPAKPEPLSKDPVLAVSFRFALTTRISFDLTLEAIRSYTDELSPPSAGFPQSTLARVPFTARAVLPGGQTSLRAVAAWAPGAIVPLGDATLASVRIEALTAHGPHVIGHGEMGASAGIRCVRIGDAAAVAPAAGPSFSAMGGMPSASAMGDAAVEMDFPAFAAAPMDFASSA